MFVSICGDNWPKKLSNSSHIMDAILLFNGEPDDPNDGYCDQTFALSRFLSFVTSLSEQFLKLGLKIEYLFSEIHIFN